MAVMGWEKSSVAQWNRPVVGVGGLAGARAEERSRSIGSITWRGALRLLRLDVGRPVELRQGKTENKLGRRP